MPNIILSLFLYKNEKRTFHCIDRLLIPKRQYDSFKLIVQQMQNEFPKGNMLCLRNWKGHLFYLYCFGDKETTPEIRDICFSCTEHFLLQTPTQSLISSFLDILIGNVSFLNNMEISSRTANLWLIVSNLIAISNGTESTFLGLLWNILEQIYDVIKHFNLRRFLACSTSSP